MKDFVIFTDSCSDLPIEYVNEDSIEFARLIFCYGKETHYDDLGQTLGYKRFFDDLRSGLEVKTSQPSTDEYYKKFTNILGKGKDILYICVSTGMSGSENGANVAREMALEDFPEGRIEIVNTLTASLGQGLFVMKAVEMKKQGKALDEIAEYIIATRENFNTYMTVDDLNHLKRGGRLSTTAAILGMVLHIKPILTINSEGRVIAINKARGRKTSISKLAEIVCERIVNPEQQIIAISHGDCSEDALKLKELITKNIKVKDVIINYIGPAVGTHGGPGSLAVFFSGRERQNHII